MALKFQGRVALVTGGGTGIGLAIAKKFAENGASVIILGRRPEPLERASETLKKTISETRSGATVMTFDGVDVSDAAGIDGMFAALKGDGVTVDYLVNNAGVSGPVTCFANASAADFDGTVGIHLTGTFWTSVRGLDVMGRGGKIITISTFFTEERPLEQRPYRFRSPYTASQGAKNRLAEAMSWELADRGIASIATNPGPVHSDRIYKTVYPKAASEFMRVSGFEDLEPGQVDMANGLILPLLGEDEGAVREGLAGAARDLAAKIGRADPSGLEGTLSRLLAKIQGIAEKIQANTSRMIANQEFLSQSQVAESVLNLCDDGIAGIINGKVMPGDRVFYPVKAHVGNAAPRVGRVDLAGRAVVFTIDAADEADSARAEHLAAYVEANGGKAVCLVSAGTPQHLYDSIAARFHSHAVPLEKPGEVARWLDTAKTNMGDVLALVHLTGRVPEVPRLTGLSRKEWEGLVARFITTPAAVARQALLHFVPGGAEDPRRFRDAAGSVLIIGPDLPAGGKVPGVRRMQVEVFRGALRPFTTTVNQELSDVLKSKARVFTVLPGSVTGAEPDNDRIANALNFLVSGEAAASSEVIFCVDETR